MHYALPPARQLFLEEREENENKKKIKLELVEGEQRRSLLVLANLT